VPNTPGIYIRKTIELAEVNVREGGGPFAALVVREGAVIASGVNQVTRANDPTAHAEVTAIREACRILGQFDLTGCELYTSCEPCPMCLGAIYWARLSRVYYAATQTDAAAAGFDDQFIYREIEVPPPKRSIPMQQVEGEDGGRPFRAWTASETKRQY
jgi:guanine deaminase